MSIPDEAEWQRPAPPRAALTRDVAIGVAMAAGAAFGVELARGLGVVSDLGVGGVEAYFWAAVIALPLCVRRRYPTSVMVAVALLFFVAGERLEASVMNNLITQASLFFAIFTAHAWAWNRRRLKVVTWLVVVGMFAWLVYGFVRALQKDLITGSDEALFSPYISYLILNSVINAAYFWGALVWGCTSWRTARQHETLERQADELASQQESNARRAVVEERLRIARELHDVVAHHISSIGVQAGGARRVLDKDPAASRQALGVIESSSRAAVAEMRQLLGTLRADEPAAADGDGAVAPPPAAESPLTGVRRLPELVRSQTIEGGDTLKLSYREIGRPLDLPDTVSVSLYRIAQEALTNIRRHSTARTGQVTLRYLMPEANDSGRHPAVEVEVIDDGRPNHDPRGSGLGHVGIRERVALHGGESEIGPRPVGGFRVRARFPVEECE